MCYFYCEMIAINIKNLTLRLLSIGIFILSCTACHVEESRLSSGSFTPQDEEGRKRHLQPRAIEIKQSCVS